MELKMQLSFKKLIKNDRAIGLCTEPYLSQQSKNAAAKTNTFDFRFPPKKWVQCFKSKAKKRSLFSKDNSSAVIGGASNLFRLSTG